MYVSVWCQHGHLCVRVLCACWEISNEQCCCAPLLLALVLAHPPHSPNTPFLHLHLLIFLTLISLRSLLFLTLFSTFPYISFTPMPPQCRRRVERPKPDDLPLRAEHAAPRVHDHAPLHRCRGCLNTPTPAPSACGRLHTGYSTCTAGASDNAWCTPTCCCEDAMPPCSHVRCPFFVVFESMQTSCVHSARRHCWQCGMQC